MGYWIRISQIPESIAVYERAAEARYLEGCELIRQGYRGGGMYLLGYVAEIFLKTVFFRNIGYAPNRTISIEDRKKSGITQSHDAMAWADRIVKISLDMPPLLKWTLLKHVTVIKRNWNESLRYREDLGPTGQELEEFTSAITWIERNRNNLVMRSGQNA